MKTKSVYFWLVTFFMAPVFIFPFVGIVGMLLNSHRFAPIFMISLVLVCVFLSSVWGVVLTLILFGLIFMAWVEKKGRLEKFALILYSLTLVLLEIFCHTLRLGC